MGKFSIGVRVSDCDGDEGVIVDKRKGERLVKYDRPLPNLWWPKCRLSLADDGAVEAAPAEAPKFKVGDRVRFVGRAGVGPIGLVGEIVHDDGDDVMPFEVSFDNWHDGHNGTANDYSDNRWNCNGDELELVTEVPLTLRVGGYYKLRNGEVIGPLIDSGNLLFRFTTNPRASFSDSWTHNGGFFGGTDEYERDIVSEAPAPAPASWGAAATAKPEPKFKVGDKVDLIRGGKPVAEWSNMTITGINPKESIYPIMTDVGLPCFENELLLSQDHQLPIGTKVTLTAPAIITGFDKKNANLVLDTGGSFVLPISALTAA